MRPLYDKFSYIQKFVQNKDVLDVGVVCHNVQFNEEWYRNQFLHDYICKSAKSVIGIDIEKDGIEKLNKCGYNVQTMNAENMKLMETFDVIVAGDLIEHLSNPGCFIKRAYEHLRKDGLLIILTPNPFNLKRCIKQLFGRKIESNLQHTCWFDVQTLTQLCERFGFELTEFRYLQHIPSHWSTLYKFQVRITHSFEYHCGTIICIFKIKI